MVRSLMTAATGMEAMQFYMDNISNNLSHMNTNGYKRTRVEFQDLMYQAIREPGVRNFEGSMAPAGIEVGLGVKVAGTQRVFEQGSPNLTENPLDIAISGEGFFQVSMPDGSIAYTRDGGFKLSNDGTLVTSSGFIVHPQVVIPEGASSFQVEASGRVSVIMPGEEISTDIGQFELARFINPAGLRSLGGNLLGVSDASGIPIISLPGEEGTGTLLQRYVEASNVQLVDEMVNMIAAQRAYEVVSKAIQTSEEMLQVANNLKR
ncbi:MAG: flagellar basal-body rod protein FlgG [Chitinispirillales bacterium]|jgi:flagellar basal-body rod protein FlgG|nr:flagellar basal-body rod protein FlgG [Chitinispirillales bacterium]